MLTVKRTRACLPALALALAWAEPVAAQTAPDVFGYFANRIEKSWAVPSLVGSTVETESPPKQFSHPFFAVMLRHQPSDRVQVYVNLNGSSNGGMSVRNSWGEYSFTRAVSVRIGRIYLDYLMPDMDGEQLGRLLAADRKAAGLRLVMLTSLPEAGDSERFAEAGFAAYLTKPVRPQMLCAVAAIVLDPQRSGPQPLVVRHTVTESASRASRPAIPRSQVPMSVPGGRRILVVEDVAVNQILAVRLLDKIGWPADVAATGREGVEMWEQGAYAMVFMDCQMPEMDGYEATREIRRREAVGRGHVPIVAMTANAMQEDRALCLAAGMDDYLSKPLRVQALSDAVNRWVPVPIAR